MEKQNTQHQDVPAPKALFWYLSLFFLLALTAVSLGSLWFQYINKLYPKEVAGVVGAPFSQDAVRYAIASLLVAAPLFLVFTFLVRRALKSGRLNVENRVRAWITYIILFVAIAIAVGDLIAAVQGVLRGDFSPRFLLRVGTILLITGWIFVYYAVELRSADALVRSPLPPIFGAVTVIVVAASFIGGFLIIDTPAQARAKAFDRTREGDLSQIAMAFQEYYDDKESLPDNLDALKNVDPSLTTTDPRTQQPYELAVVDDETARLCATFETSGPQVQDDRSLYYRVSDDFVHDAGHQCFHLTVRKDSLEILPLIERIPAN